MTDTEQKELLVDVLHALFGPQLKGKYIVEFRGSTTIDADDRHDAIEKAKKLISEDPSKVLFNAYKIDDLINEE